MMKSLFFLVLLFLIMMPAYAQVDYLEVLPTDKSTLNIGLAMTPTNPKPGEITTLKIDFINPKTNKIQQHIDYKVTVTKDGNEILGPTPLHTNSGLVKIQVPFRDIGVHEITVAIEGILFQPLPQETAVFTVAVGQMQDTQQSLQGADGNEGGCLIATATYGSELSPQVQQLRELRDNALLQTNSGSAFMSGFNEFYYSFSPTIADWERQNPAFKEAVKITITPLITSLSLLNYADIDSEAEVLGYGISLILLNIGMYIVAPVGIVILVRREFWKFLIHFNQIW